MPPVNPGRVINAEHNAAQRIKLEREKRGWSLERTAKAMEEAGCPLASTAILKIERPKNPRRIQLDEAVAFSRVFDLSLDELLRSVDEVRVEQLNERLNEWLAERAKVEEARREADKVMVSMIELAEDSSELDQMGERGRFLSTMLEEYRANGRQSGAVRTLWFPDDDMVSVSLDPEEPEE